MLVSVLFWLGASAQGTLPYTDNFESYTTGGFLAAQSITWWTTWSGATGGGEDGQISTDVAYSGTKSVLCDVTGLTATDQIWKLGNKTSGAYEVKWMMYVGTGYCGYYNFQHYQSPGTQWAFEVYFRTNGTMSLEAGGVTTTYSYPKATWFEVKHLIDIDNDTIQLFLNGTFLRGWPFHYQASGTTGTNQLGGVDLFAGEFTGSGEIPKFYFDDVSYTSYVAANDPKIAVSPTSMTASQEIGQITTQQLTVSDTGVVNLVYSTNIILNSDAPVVNRAALIEPSVPSQKGSLHLCSADPNPSTGAANPPTDAPGATAVLHYDGDNYSAIGWGTPPSTITVAARFPNNMTLPNAGLYLESVDVYINDLNATASNLMTVKIFGMGTDYEPGVLLSSQTFTPTADSWNNIVLTTPVLVTGQDLWIGYQFTQAEASIFIPGTDAGPADPNGDFLSTGVGWSHLSTNPALNYNWNIRGNLNGTLMPQWLSVSPASGTVTPGGSQPLTVTFNSTNLEVGAHQAIIRFLSNDPTMPQLDVPVTLTVIQSACPAPSGLSATNITGQAATINWNGAPEVQIDYGLAGHAVGTGTIIPGYVTSQNLTGLNYLTSYDVYVRQVCGVGNYSPWMGPLNFTTLEQYAVTLYPVSATNGTGYISNGSFLKNGPAMNTSTAVSDTLGRGYMKFDISSLPLNAVVTKATLNYYNFYRAGTSTADNAIFSLANDPITTTGATLYSDCGDGAPLWTGVWGGTAPVWINSLLNTTGKNYIMDQIASGWAGFGLVRGSTLLYKFAGYNDATYKPTLQLEYHVVATGPELGVNPASMNYDPVNLGLQSLPQVFRIKNTGSGSLAIDGLSLQGTDVSQFILSGNTGFVNLGPGQSYTVTVTFKPTSTGIKTANLVVSYNENEYPYPLTGTGYLNGPQNLTATPVIGPYVNLAWEAPLPLAEIRYDDDGAESHLWVGSPTTTSQMFYTRITIPVNGTLTAISVESRNASTTWESIRLCPDNGGFPNLAAPVESFTNVPVTSATGQWIVKNLTTPLSVTQGQNYYVVAQWPAGSTVGPMVGVDQSGNHYRCAYTSDGGISWIDYPANWMMRAYMNPVSDDPGRSFTNYTVNRGTTSGTWTTSIPGISGTTYQDVSTAATTQYYYMITAQYSNGVANSNIAGVTTFELCPVPTTLTATGITSTSANLGWNANGTTAWQIEWGVSGFTQGTGTMITSGVTNPYTLNGLSAGASYSYYVRSFCGGSLYSSWAGPFTFNVPCVTTPAPFTEGFEGTTFPPVCWSLSASAAAWVRSTSASGYGTGIASAFANFYNITAGNTFDLNTFVFSTTGLYQPVLKFDHAYATYDAAYVDEMDVYYSTDGGNTWTLLLAMPGGATGILNTGGVVADPYVPIASEWATQTLALPAGANMIRFTAISQYGNNLYLDNVRVEASALPQNVTATGTVTNGQSLCYNATGTITVAGGTSTFEVQSGGSVELVAGVNILFLPGTRVLSGGYLWGHIGTNWCGDAPIMAAPVSGVAGTAPASASAAFLLFPNPTNGNFTLVQKGDRMLENVTVEICSLRGEKVLTTRMTGEKSHEFTTSELPAGLYFVKIVSGGNTETVKLIKTR